MSPQSTTRLDSVPVRAHIGFVYEYTTATLDDPPAVIVGHLARRGALDEDVDLERVVELVANVRTYRVDDTPPSVGGTNE